MTEREICDRLYAVVKEGARARVTGASCTYGPATLASMLHSVGWVQEDLRQALKKDNPSYGAGQDRLEQAGVFGDLYRKETKIG